MRAGWRVFAVSLAGATVLASVAAARTTVIEYTYNADGALTAISKQVDGGAAERTYLTWDNFVPDETDPASGQVARADGRLASLGPAPGAAGAVETFDFDSQDRLRGYSGPAGSETFDYHAKGSMSSSSLGSDELSFFYDDSANAHVTNIHQSATDSWSAYLGRVRYLDDGREQVLLQPRKDLACSYRADGERVDSYRYDDAFGDAPLLTPPNGTYDLSDNPFRYAGEYRDPIWGGYYLRARWYDPRLTVFLSRDAEANLSRYGYAGGNPAMRVDPNGLKFSYFRDLAHPLGHFLRTINAGFGGHIVRLLFAPILGPLEIMANPKGFWHAIKTNQSDIDVFLALSVATQFIGGTVAAASTAGIGKILLAQTITEVGLGTTQSAVAAAGRGHHFDWNTFVQGEEYTISGALYGAALTGGVRALARPRGITGVARNLESAPDESSVSSVSRGLRRSESSEQSHSRSLESYHEELLSSANDEDDVTRARRIEKEVHQQQRGLLNKRSQLQQEIAEDAKTRLTLGTFDLLKNQKRFSIRVSKLPDFMNIVEEEEDETSEIGVNQAHVHAGAIIEELE